MSTTIANLVDRVFREYLEPMEDVVSYSYLTSGIDENATTISYDGDLFSVEEEDALDAGAILEVGQFPRVNVFNAVKDQIENLYPTLYAVETQTISSAVGYVALVGADDNRIVAPLKAVSQYQELDAGNQTTVQFRGVAMELIDVPTSVTASGKVVQFSGVSTGVNVHCTFKKKFGEVSLESTTLADIGLETEYEPIIMAGVAAQMIAGKDIPTYTADYITDQMAATNYPVNSSSNIRNSLLQYQQVLINQARKDLRARYPEPVSLNSVVYPSA